MPDRRQSVHNGSLFFNEPSGVIEFIDVVVSVAEKICKDENLAIRIDEFLCIEVHSRARETISFHGTEQYSIYKEVAHLAYWFNRLKPARIVSPMNIFRTMEMARHALDEWTLGRWVKLEGHAITEEERLTSRLDLPVNERMAVLFTSRLIFSAQDDQADTLGGTLGAAYKIAVDDSRRRVALLSEKLEKSLRDHNHSARGMATMIEIMFRLHCEQE